MLVAGAAVLLSNPGIAVAADALSIQKHLERMLGGSAPEDLGVLRQDRETFHVRVKTGLLFRPFQIEPTVTTSPRQVDLTAKNLGDGRWSFEGSNSFSSATDDELEGRTRTTFAKAARAELKGIFDPARGALNTMEVSYFDGRYFLTIGEDKYNVNYKSAAFFLEETTGKDRLSRSKIGVSADGYTFNVHEQAMSGQVIGQHFTYSIEADGLDYRSLKDQIRFGERISLHSSTGDLDYPDQTLAAMRDFEVRLSGDDITSTEGVEGIRAGAVDLTLSGKVPSDEARSAFKFEARNLEFVGPKARRFFLPFIPANLSIAGHVSGIDFRKLYLRSNILSNVGTTLDESYFDNNLTPSGKLKLTGVEGSLVRDTSRIDFKGDMTVDLATESPTEMKMEIRSKDIDKVIAENTERGRTDSVAGTLQFMLFFLKGVARHEGATSVWTVERKDGRITINGANLGRF